ncbi:MAG: hypothetical protein ACM3P1_05505 [Candidatus Saccharibacteria bacterium]
MNRNLYLFVLLMSLAFPLASCNDEEVQDPKAAIVKETDFNLGADGWVAVYAEFPQKDTAFYELEHGIQSLPTPLDATKKGFMLSGNNHSDALQMYLSRQISGLDPNTNYSIETEVELASMYPSGSVGIGGSPGNAVHLVSKFSTLGYTLEPGKSEQDNVKLVLNKQGSVLEQDLGDVSISSDQYVYQLINRKKSSASQMVKSDQNGKLWAVVGTWSGFEGITTLYYTKIKITLTKM